jgi:hypothetical protein
MTMHWSKGLAAATMAAALAAGAQTTVHSSSTASSFTTTATGGGQSGTTPTVKDDLFNGTEIFAKGATDVTEITMDPASLDMVGGKRSNNAKSMVLNVVRTYSYDKPGMYKIEDVETFRNKLNTGDWHCSVHTRSLKTGSSTDVCRKQRTDDLTETAIITVEPKSLTFIHTISHGGGWTPNSMVEGMPLFYSLPGHGSLAMLDPEAFADMAIAKARMAGMNLRFEGLQANLDSTLSQMPSFDGKDLQKQLDGAMKARDKAEELRKRTQPETSSPQQPE